MLKALGSIPAPKTIVHFTESGVMMQNLQIVELYYILR
jgi:hypothetical protein